MDAIGYVRVSSTRQEEEGFSIPAQKKLITEYSLQHGFKLVKVFEEAESAKKAGRTEFQKMTRFIKDSGIKVVLVEKTDRLYRNFSDYSNLDIDANDLEVHLIKENQTLSKDSRANEKFVHGIKVLMAKNYSDNLSEEVKKGQKEKAEQGWYPSVAPLGYVNQDKIIKPHPEYAHLITKAFELFATGEYSLARLSQKLFNMGLKSKRVKKKLSKSRMQGLIQNPIYYGDFNYNGVHYTGKHEALISYDLYLKANEKLGEKLKPKSTKLFFAFGNLMTCYYCGCTITAEKKRKPSGKTYTYYHCTKGKGKCENPFYLNEVKVEKVIIEALDRIKLSSEIIEWTSEAIEKTHNEEKKFRSKEIASLQGRYNQLESFQDSIYEDKLKGTINEDFWKKQQNAFSLEQRKILDRLKKFDCAADSLKLNGIKLLELANKASQLFKNGTPEEKYKITKLVLSNPVFKDGSIEYCYEKPFDKFVNVTDLSKWREC